MGIVGSAERQGRILAPGRASCVGTWTRPTRAADIGGTGRAIATHDSSSGNDRPEPPWLRDAGQVIPVGQRGAKSHFDVAFLRASRMRLGTGAADLGWQICGGIAQRACRPMTGNHARYVSVATCRTGRIFARGVSLSAILPRGPSHMAHGTWHMAHGRPGFRCAEA